VTLATALRDRVRRLGWRLGSFALFAACLAEMPGTRLWAQGGNGVIFGRVTDSRGHPQRVSVHLLADGEVSAGDAYTDSNGLFAFRSLPNGDYYVLVEAEGYKPARQHARLDMQIDPKAQVQIALEPLEKGPQEPGQIVSGSPKSHELNSKKPTPSYNPKALREFEKGNAKERKGDFPAAIVHYQEALRLEPSFYPALNNLGTVLEKQRDHAQAEAAFLKSLKINSDDAEAYINLGHVLYEEGKYGAAIERLEQGLQRFPRSAVAHFFLGSAYLRLGNLEKAEPNLKTASTLDPDRMAPAHLQLANLYLRRRDLTAASTELESYLQANPSDPRAPAIKKMLADIKNHPSN
jgi:tetratricopeptide (TPR) repeat protein